MKVMRNNSGNAKKPARAVTKIVSVSDFIQDESGKAVGIRGVSFPDKTEVEIILSTSGANAENAKRRDFEAYRKGFKAPNGSRVAIEPGAVLRLNCKETGENSFETEWINVLAGNRESSKQALRFGYCAVELYTPEPVKEIYREVAATLKAETPDVSKYDIENALLEKIKGERRYNGNVLLYHPGQIMEAEAASLCETLAGYYGSGKFAKVTSENSDKTYEPVSPGVVIRALNADGEVLAAMDVTGAMLYKAKAETPTERAAYAASLTDQLGFGDAASYSLLPYDKIRISEYSLTVEDNTITGIKSFARAQSMSFEKVTDESGETGYENRAMQAVVKSAGNGMISELALPDGARSVDIALLAKDGSEMKEAGREKEEESDGNSPGM